MVARVSVSVLQSVQPLLPLLVPPPDFPLFPDPVPAPPDPPDFPDFPSLSPDGRGVGGELLSSPAEAKEAAMAKVTAAIEIFIMM